MVFDLLVLLNHRKFGDVVEDEDAASPAMIFFLAGGFYLLSGSVAEVADDGVVLPPRGKGF